MGGKFFIRILTDPEKKALFNFRFLAFRLNVKNQVPLETVSFTSAGVQGRYLKDLLPFTPQVSNKALSAIAVLYIESSVLFLLAKSPKNSTQQHPFLPADFSLRSLSVPLFLMAEASRSYTYCKSSSSQGIRCKSPTILATNQQKSYLLGQYIRMRSGLRTIASWMVYTSKSAMPRIIDLISASGLYPLRIWKTNPNRKLALTLASTLLRSNGIRRASTTVSSRNSIQVVGRTKEGFFPSAIAAALCWLRKL